MSMLAVVAALVSHAKDIVIPTVERGGRPYVSVASLAGHADIAIKELPGRGQWVACSGERCALLKEIVREGDETLVPVSALADTLGATARFDTKKARAILSVQPPAQTATSASPRPGRLAPDIRLTGLDGAPVSLAEFAGKRVLINSWASW